MKKCWVLSVLLLVLSVSALAAGHHKVNAYRDKIGITETTLDGDPAAAEGLTVSLNTACDDQLFWHTAYTAGTDPAPETRFVFSAIPIAPEGTFLNYAYLEIGFSSFRISGFLSQNNIDLDIDEGSASVSSPFGVNQMTKPAADVARRTQAGETHTETVYLHDYYSHYRVNLQFGAYGIFELSDLSSPIDWSQKNILELSQYFQFPVPEDLQVRVSISKNKKGNIYQVECEPVEGTSQDESSADMSSPETTDTAKPVLNNGGIVTKEGFYLILWTETGEAADMFSEIADGYGVYFIPIRQLSESKLCIATDQIQNIYPMEPDTAQAVYILEGRDGASLLLFTQEQDQLVLTVLDKETGTPRQRLPLPSGRILFGTQGEDLLILYIQDGTSVRMLVLPKEEGVYSLWLNTVTADEEYLISRSIDGFCFDGKRLAIAFFRSSYYASIRLQVYDQTGLLYSGDYVHSGDPIASTICHHWSDCNLTLSWKPESAMP